MATIQRKMRKGTTAEHTVFTGVLAEVTVDTTKKTAVVHDGSTAGGFPLAKEDLSNAASFTGATSSVAGSKGVVPAPAAGDEGKFLSGDGTWKAPKFNIVSVTTQTRTLVASDADSYMRFTYAGAKTYTIPLNATVAIAIGTTISGISANGQLTFAGAVGVTIHSNKSLKLADENYASFALVKVGTDEWDLAGSVVA